MCLVWAKFGVYLFILSAGMVQWFLSRPVYFRQRDIWFQTEGQIMVYFKTMEEAVFFLHALACLQFAASLVDLVVSSSIVFLHGCRITFICSSLIGQVDQEFFQSKYLSKSVSVSLIALWYQPITQYCSLVVHISNFLKKGSTTMCHDFIGLFGTGLLFISNLYYFSRFGGGAANNLKD